MRIAGTGNAGVDLGGSVPPGSRAINTDLAVPSTITLDPRGDPVFIDGYSPGRVVRITPAGELVVVAAIPISPSVEAPLLDGPFENATAYTFSGLAFVDDGNALLIADTAQYSFVRRLDLTTKSITRIFGAYSGFAKDGHPFLQTVFASITAITTLPGGSVLVVDGGVSLIRVGIADGATFVSTHEE